MRVYLANWFHESSTQFFIVIANDYNHAMVQVLRDRPESHITEWSIEELDTSRKGTKRVYLAYWFHESSIQFFIVIANDYNHAMVQVLRDRSESHITEWSIEELDTSRERTIFMSETCE